MLKDLLAYIVPLLLWGALSGVLNLILTRKSQIETWVNAHPRLAAWSKLLRSIGFDPWAAHAWLTLLGKKRLPEAQQADSPIAKLERRKADDKRLGPTSIIPPTMLLMLCLVLLVGCDPRKPPCDESKLRAVDLRFVERVTATCLPKYDRAEDCPEYPALKAQHRAELRQECLQ